MVSAEIDPDHKVQIDRNDFNNSHVVEANSKPTHKAVDLLALCDAVDGPGSGLVGSVNSD